MRFRTEQHLRRQSDIRGVRESGRRIECRAFTLWWRLRPLDGVAAIRPPTPEKARTAPPSLAIAQPRVCVIASTAAVGNATQRNRAKRRLRELFRHQQQLIPPDCDLLLIARNVVLQWSTAELEKKFAGACGQISSSLPLPR